ncbi:hypothetical protein CLV49_0919 [Labedella gwakjiensis]|uniref:Uncharacterized protein n=1 Tax=Labedella gwakjiensis TaxID=390269 RepID=A0A2P8GTP0_9MICO|nr:hypothetical protein [Labedella gwakjiensis]PSL37312.1 hypothetical protein CLV49_0919 [Labedella gwakjiensis]RUQ84637.1 hypothetical protein ELQ93_13630 [Labedella gwakjiensis]
MRIVAVALSTVIGLVVITTTTVGMPTIGVSGGAIVPFVSALVAFWGVGFLASAIPAVSLRDPSSADGRRASRIFAGASAAVALAAALLVAVPTVAGDVPLAVGSATVAGGALYVAANGALGRYLRRRAEGRRLEPFAIPPLDPDYSRRRARSVVVISATVLIIGVFYALAAGRPAVESAPSTPTTIAMAVSLTAIVASVMCAVPVVTLSGRVRDLSGTDAARLRRIRGVVLRGKRTPLSDDELDIAARYAPFAAQSQRWTLAQTLTLLVALLAINEPVPDRPLQLAIWIAFPILAVIVTALGLRAAHRAETYALAHRNDAPGAASPADALSSGRS